jgi:hypothetical protein
MSTPLTFAELEEGAKFIAFPIDGDDSGHGGFRKGSYLFTKIKPKKGRHGANAVKSSDNTFSTMTPSMQVLLVI